MSALSNPLTTYDDVLNHYETSGFGDRATPEDFRTNAVEQALQGLEQDANGHYYRGDERVYVYHDSSELGDDSNGFKGENVVMRTEAEIKEAWEADEGMGYFKEANPDLDFDTYMAFISDKDDMYASGELDINPHDDLYNVGHKGRGPKSDAINAILAEEKDRVRAAEAAANSALQEKYGIETSFSNDDGDQFEFNGSTYTKTMKVDDHLGVGDYVKIGAGVLMSVYAGPMIAGSLGGIMGPAAAKAASAGIMNLANQFVQDGSLSLTDAVMAAGTQYLGGQVWDKVSGGVMDAVGAAEGGDLTKVVDAYEASGKYSAETISKMRDVADNAYNGMGDAGGVFDKIKDLAGGVDFKDIYDQVTGGDRTDDVDYGGATSEITNDGIQNEDDEFEEDFGVDVEIEGPDFPEVVETEDTDGGGGGGGGGGDVDGGGDVTGGGGSTDGGGDTTQGQYEVISKNPDGTYIVKDNVDGDVWIIEGDYTIGDYIPEADMGTATGAEGDLETGTNNDATEDVDVNSPITNAQIDILINRGMTQEEAVANQNSAIKQGADANNDGMVTDAEWSEHAGGDATGGDATTGTEAGGDGTGQSGTIGSGQSVGAGTGTGTGTGSGNGNGDGSGDGDGDGDGQGQGQGQGDGTGMLGGAGGDGRPDWGPLFPGSQFKKFQKRRTGIVQSLFEDLMQ